MAGYSSTSLIRKLGIRPGMRLVLVDPPGTLARELGQLPGGCRAVARGRADYIHGFFSTRAARERRLLELVRRLAERRFDADFARIAHRGLLHREDDRLIVDLTPADLLNSSELRVELLLSAPMEELER